MLVLVGESASGKTSLQNALIKHNPDFKKIVTYTTRPKRKNEKNGVDYHFVSEAKFQKMVKKGYFIEHTKYRDWYYGTAKKDCINNDKSVVVLNPPGLRALKRINSDITSVYLYVDRRFRLINILLRKDNLNDEDLSIDEAYRRNLSDVGQFNGIIDEVDYVIDNTEYHMNEEEVLKCLLSILKEAGEDVDE